MPLKAGGFLTIYLDVTEQRRDQATIAHLAHHDPLTSLPNRALFSDRLQNAIALSKRSGLVALHFLDIDNFKPVNDRHGHEAGDALLVAIAERLRGAVRENDTVARLGGDEFAVVQTGIEEVSDAAVLADCLVSEMAKPFMVLANMITVGASVGVSIAPIDGTSTDVILRKADSALYRSKFAGRAQIQSTEATGSGGRPMAFVTSI